MRPDQRQSRHSPTEPIFVGFAGRTGAGKTCAARHLSAKYGFQYIRYSQVLQDWLSTAHTDRDRLRSLGWDVMAEGRQAELNRRLIAGLDRTRSAAVDGLRHPIDFDSLSDAMGPSFRLVFVEARQAIRFERLRARFKCEEEIRAADLAPVEAHIDGLRHLATATISNEGSLAHLYEILDAWVEACGNGDLK